MAAVEEQSRSTDMFTIDEAYEFSAPRFFDFVAGETDCDAKRAEDWFEKTVPYAPSPFMLRIKATRSVHPHILCNFGEEDQVYKGSESSEQVSNPPQVSAPESQPQAMTQVEAIPEEAATIEEKIDDKTSCENQKAKNAQVDKVSGSRERSSENKNFAAVDEASTSLHHVQTPVPQKPETAKNQTQKSQVKSNIKPPGSLKKNTAGTPSFAHENHAIKRQKLDEGKLRQIRTVGNPANLPHKTRTGGLIGNSSSSLTISSNANKTCKEERKIYTREQPVVPFVSTAEMMRKFQSGTRELSLSRNSSVSQGKPKLTLTRPKTPEFETSQRVRSVKIKSSAELEEEMMANIPRFKARPVNKKIMQAPTLPPLPRATPHPPEFKEFHLETTSRANQNSETSTVASIETTESHQWKPQLTAPKSPVLQTSLRARPPKFKSSEELMKEELQKVPQFKARPLNRKILESKGDIGIFSHMKKQLTIPQEFNFAVDKRIPPPTIVLDQFDKLSINSESQQQDKKSLPKNTVPNPFHLQTEERGLEKEKRLAEELTQKQLEEERARIPKAHPYPYTTDYPVVPPKPEPKPITKPEPFQLECLVRYEEEMQREMEEKRRMEMEEAQMRMFKAQPILKEDPIPVPAKTRKPLTEVQEFNLHVDNRAVDRAEFDKKIKEKEKIYKRYREEAESARMMEEEKAVKQLRRTLVPQARPVPNFDRVFIPQRSCKQTTKAKSPKLLVDRRNENRMACPPSSLMR